MARIEKETLTKEVVYFTMDDLREAVFTLASKADDEESEAISAEAELVLAVGAALSCTLEDMARGEK